MQLFQIKQFLKTCSVSNYTKKLKQLLEKIEENANFIEKERAKISFSLNDDKMITAWETSIKTKRTPLLTFYENWSKINKIQKRKKVTKNDELAGELPLIKRPKISEENPVAKTENKGPLVLFPSDSEDDKDTFGLDDDEPSSPKVKKVKKKDKKNKKIIKKKVSSNTAEHNNVGDKDDIVQEFSVSDW